MQNSTDLFVLIYRKRKLIFLITIIGAIASIIASLLITPKYKSTVVFFPASSSSVSKALLTDMSRAPKDILKFGEEEEAEQLLQVLHSDEIKIRIVEKYDLIKHYEIDESSAYPYTSLSKEFDNNIKYRKTKFQSIEISVLDTDPKIAALIANDIAALLDTVMNNLQHSRAEKALIIVNHEYEKVRLSIGNLEDSLAVLSDLKSNKSAKYESSHIAFSELLLHETQQLSLLKTKLAEAEVDAKQNLPFKYIINQAYVAEKKDYPVRWLIVVVSTIATFIFAISLLIAFEFIQNIQTELSKKH